MARWSLPTALPSLPTSVPTWQEIGASPTLMRRAMNIWPPFLFAGIRVLDIDAEFRSATVELRLTPLSRNYMGTQYGGSMFSMTDPFVVVLLHNRLGPGYRVFDVTAQIDFLLIGRSTVRATIVCDDEFVESIRAEAADGAKVFRETTTDIVDEAGALVAQVRRRVYIRRTQQ